MSAPVSAVGILLAVAVVLLVWAHLASWRADRRRRMAVGELERLEAGAELRAAEPPPP